jgi:PASTA domain
MPIAAFGVIAALTFGAPVHADDDAPGPTAQQDCTALSWPQPLPNAVGRQLEDIVNDDSFWICLNVVAMAPDGHDVMDDNSGVTQSRRITSQSPQSGTPVAENETITLNVAP